MKTSKVLEITKVNEWDGPHGKLYYINMKLENGETISLGKKKADAFKVGDTVNYEDYIDSKGQTKQKEVVENKYEKKTYNSESTNKSATVGMALKVAFEVLYDPKKENFSECIALAHRIYDEAMAMYNEGSSESKLEETTENDPLPF